MLCDIGISFLAVIDWMVQGVTYRKRGINWGRFQNLEDLISQRTLLSSHHSASKCSAKLMS